MITIHGLLIITNQSKSYQSVYPHLWFTKTYHPLQMFVVIHCLYDA
jgi:hypothetical protein